MASNYSNGNGNGNQRVYFALSLSLGGLGFITSLFLGAYTLANPKGDVMIVREDLRRESERLAAEVLHAKQFSSEKLLTKDEHLVFVKYVDQYINNLKEDINRIRTDQVTRSEYQQRGNETDSRIAVVRDMNTQLRKEMFDSVATLQKDIGGQYTVGDQIKNLQDQIKNMSSRLDALRTRSPQPAVQ